MSLICSKRTPNSEAIESELKDFSALKQKTSENEDSFYARFVSAHARARSLWDSGKKISYYVKGSLPKIRPPFYEFRYRNANNQDTDSQDVV